MSDFYLLIFGTSLFIYLFFGLKLFTDHVGKRTNNLCHMCPLKSAWATWAEFSCRVSWWHSFYFETDISTLSGYSGTVGRLSSRSSCISWSTAAGRPHQQPRGACKTKNRSQYKNKRGGRELWTWPSLSLHRSWAWSRMTVGSLLLYSEKASATWTVIGGQIQRWGAWLKVLPPPTTTSVKV